MGASGDTVEATTFEDDFSSDNWTDYGSDFGVSGGTMAWNKTVNSGSWINLGSSLSDEKWVCRFTLNILNASSFNNEQPIFMIGSVSGSVTDATTMDYIGFQLQTYSNDYYIWCGNGATLASPTFNTNLSKTITTGTVYVELRRTSATEVILSIYSDSGFSSLSATKTLTISSGITGLQYFRLHSRLAGTGTINGTIDNLEIYNGLSSVTGKPKQALSLSGCKAYYNFEQTSGSLTNIATTANGFDDGLGSSADGTSSGGVTQNATGKVGSYAWDFDGSDDYVNVSGITLPAYNSTDTFSISAWINMDTLATSPTQYQRLFHWYDGTKQWQLYIFSSGEIGFNNTQANQGVDTSSSVISTGTWYHLVVVKTGNNTYKIYLNGVDQSTTSSGGGNPSPSIQTFRIGASITGSGSDGHFNGRIDEFSVFTRALTSSEISTLYNDGTGVAVNDSSITAKPETNSIFVETDTASRWWFDGNYWNMQPTFEDDFSSDNWIDQDTKQAVTGGALAYDPRRDNTNDASSYDLQTVLGSGVFADNNAWVLQYVQNHSKVYSSGNGNRLWFGISDSPSSTAQNGTHDFIGLYQNFDGTSYNGAVGVNGAALPQNNTGTVTPATSTNYYTRISRINRTTMRVQVWTGGYDEVVFYDETLIISADIQNLRYLWIGNLVDAAGGNSITGTIDDVKFYNGVSSVQQ